MRRDEATTTQGDIATIPTASTAVESLTGHSGSSYSSNAENDPERMVDYNDSTHLPSPMDDEGNGCMWHRDGYVDPITDAQNAPVKNHMMLWCLHSLQITRLFMLRRPQLA